MRTQKYNHCSRYVPFMERLSGHPLRGFARILGGAGFWISHVIIVSGVAVVLRLMWSDTTINRTIETLATMMFGVALLFAFAGWIAGRSH